MFNWFVNFLHIRANQGQRMCCAGDTVRVFILFLIIFSFILFCIFPFLWVYIHTMVILEFMFFFLVEFFVVFFLFIPLYEKCSRLLWQFSQFFFYLFYSCIIVIKRSRMLCQLSFTSRLMNTERVRVIASYGLRIDGAHAGNYVGVRLDSTLQSSLKFLKQENKVKRMIVHFVMILLD